MYNLHIEHTVSDFGQWKKLFDSDPIGRQKMGVRAYQVQRSVEDPNQVTVDLQFDTAEQAQALGSGLQESWRRNNIQVIQNPKMRVTEILESVVLTEQPAS